MIKVMVSGACGRMGQAVLKAVIEDSELELVGAVDLAGGADAGELVGLGKNGVIVGTDLEAVIDASSPEVMVDFTRPDVVYANAVKAIKKGVSPVIGTTGLSDEEKAELAELSKANNTPVFIAPNFAIGAVLMMLMARQAAKYMPEVEIIELHHDKKLDAPSGTALQTAAMISEVRKAHVQGNPEETEKVAGARGADVDGMRIHSVRLPGYVAHQEVIFGGLGQTLTIRHDSLNRESFMPGVCLACKKVRNLEGLVIGLDKIMD
ncbi:MAG: 4-hydroxy-tetrahydrodipicolinate reductase [Selenomonadales bacterium]|nr:4-hydroxy-tetrahydrodipicolinate reductase [Selenomonadales bacterium]